MRSLQFCEILKRINLQRGKIFLWSLHIGTFWKFLLMVVLREVRDSDKEIYKIGTPDLNRTKREGTPKGKSQALRRLYLTILGRPFFIVYSRWLRVRLLSLLGYEE